MWPDERLTFSEFAERTRACARALHDQGVQSGDRVGVQMPNRPGMLVAIYGAMRLGAIPVPINGRYKEREVAYVVEHAGIEVLLRDEPAAHGPVEEVAGDPAMIMYTSGTTSHPKGCLLSHESLVRTARTFGTERFPMRHGDRMWDPLPLFHLASILPFNACLGHRRHLRRARALRARRGARGAGRVHGRVRGLRPDLGRGARSPAVRRVRPVSAAARQRQRRP